jgi:exopolyphosphatase/guanosine-5'-triphosphate,3'-diphosphate pyrophosphatase
MTNPNAAQRVVVIDLGSNTARLIVLQAVPGHAWRLEDEIREVVRLRQGMTDAGLSAEAMERAFAALRLFKRFADAVRADVVIATATSAVRDSVNGKSFIRRVEKELKLALRILDGEREAFYGVIGALNDVALTRGAVIDIGGGSAQVSQIADRAYVRGQSAPLGALALTERFIRHDPPTDAEIDAVRREIGQQLDHFTWLDGVTGDLVGLGGTIRNVARMDALRVGYPLPTLQGYVVAKNSVAESIRLLRELPLKQRLKVPGLRGDRADIILPGIMVLHAVMERLGADEVTVSINGLREGLFYEHFWGHWENPVIPDIRSFGVLNLARIYQYQKIHANHVRFLAGRLFEQTSVLHGYGAAERELLEAAAILHDIGVLISYDDHDRHSQTLIEHAGLPGFTPREIALIALLTRYHRKGTPALGAYAALMRPDDEQLLLRMAALLRTAEYLERGRSSAVDDVAVSWGGKRGEGEYLRLTLIADEYPAVEMWDAQRNAAELLEKAFGKAVRLESTVAPEGMRQKK